MQFEECALKLNASDFEADQRPKQSHRNAILPAHPQELYLLEKIIRLNHKNIRSPIMQCRRKLINLLRHGSLPRENDGAIEFWRIEDYLQNHFMFLSTSVWRKVEEQHGRRRRKQEKISVLY